MRFALIAGLLALLLAACTSPPGGSRAVSYAAGTRALATADGLHRVRAHRTDALFVLPGGDLAGYTSFTVAPIEVFYREPRAGEPIHRFQKNEGEWFDAMVRGELEAAFGDTLALTTSPGPEVLRVRAQFVDFALGNIRRPGVGQVVVLSTSEFRLYLDLSDSITGESLVRQVDHRRVMPTSLGDPGPQPPVRPVSTRVSKVGESAALRHAVGNRARSLRERFDTFRVSGSFPPRN